MPSQIPSKIKIIISGNIGNYREKGTCGRGNFGSADGAQFSFACAALILAGVVDLGFDPFAVHAVFGEHEKQFVVEPDGFGDLLVELSAALDIFGREPTLSNFPRIEDIVS